MSFCSLIKGITPTIRMLCSQCPNLINSVLLNFLRVWIKFLYTRQGKRFSGLRVLETWICTPRTHARTHSRTHARTQTHTHAHIHALARAHTHSKAIACNNQLSLRHVLKLMSKLECTVTLRVSLSGIFLLGGRMS